MGCVNHPNAPVAATCKSCSAELCGTCTRFLDAGEYCELCAKLAEAEAQRKSREKMEEERNQVLARSTSERIIEEEEREKAKSKDAIYIKGGIGVAFIMLFVSIGLYAYPDLRKSDAQIAQEQAIMNLEACREVFQAIGIRLSEGEIPDSTMSCPGTNIPNIVLRQGNRITVSHPNPRQFGLDEMYVTNDSHRVVMVGQGQG